MFPPNYTSMELSTDFFWIDAEFLRRFMSCEKTLEDEMNDEGSRRFVDVHGIRCKHYPCGVGPRLARKGKLLPRCMFESLMMILKIEGGDRMPCMVSSDQIACEKCDESFKLQLSTQLQRLRKIVYLYEKFDPKEEERLPQSGEGNSDEDAARSDVFLVSRKFITAFRAEVAKLMKRASAAEVTGPIDSDLLLTSGDFMGEGLDALHLESFLNGKACNDVDFTVNTSITCTYVGCEIPFFTSFRGFS